MEVSEAARVHQHPALLRVLDGAVVPQEPAPAAFEVDAGVVEGNVDGVCGAVMVGPKKRLLVWPVPHHKVH